MAIRRERQTLRRRIWKGLQMKVSTYEKLNKIMPWVLGVGLTLGVGATIVDLILQAIG